MMVTESMLKAELAREEADRVWREAQATEEREWRQRQSERERQWRKEDRWSALAMLIVAAVSGVLGAIATLIAGGQWP